MQAQCVLFRRYPEVLQPFKYAGYPMLLQAITLPSSDKQAEGQGPSSEEHQGGNVSADESVHFLDPSKMPQLQVGCAWLDSAWGRLRACPVALPILHLGPGTHPCCISLCSLGAQWTTRWVRKPTPQAQADCQIPYGLGTSVQRCV